MAAALLRSSVAASSSLRGMASGRLASGLMFRRSAPVAAATRSPLMVAAAAMHARHASGSASGHNDHHEKHDGYSTGDSTALWAIGSAMVFVPSLLYLTRPSDDHYDHRAASSKKPHLHHPTHSDLLADEALEDANDTNDVPSSQVTAFKYVLVGGGTASYSAVLGIREVDPTGEILILAAEPHAPYQRPPLTKELWFTEDTSAAAETLQFTNWEGKNTSLFYKPISDYELIDVTHQADLVPTGSGLKLVTGHRAVKLDTERQAVVLENGVEVPYEKVLLATGGTPRKLSYQKTLPEPAQKRVVTYRTLDDFKKLVAVAKEGKHIAVIGGGFLGSELSVALAKHTSTTQVFPEEGNMALVFPKYLTKWTTQQVRAQGVEVLNKSTVTDLRYDDAHDKVIVEVNGVPCAFDHVVVAAGIEPNVSLARNAGLEIDSVRGGIVVNAELEARRNVFCAGDNVSFHDVALGRRRVEHYDNAVLQGRWAGRSMAGKPKPFIHQSMFWSDLGPKIGYEAMGVLDGSLVTVGVWAHDESKKAKDEQAAAAAAAAAANVPVAAAADKPVGKPGTEEYRKGVVFYVRDDTIVGVLMFNVHGKVDIARRILLTGHSPAEAHELAKKFDLAA